MSQEPVDVTVPTVDGMPMLGLGTYQNTGEQCAESVQTALEIGYRHVDTAQMYDNEEAVGEGIERADVDRDDVFLATKIWYDSLSYDDVLDTADACLDRLGVDYLDLLYVHWPAGDYAAEDTLAAFDELHDRGTIEHVGVSNFTPELLDEARDVLDAPLFANQVEMHPLLPQEELRSYADDHDIELVAYAPLARGTVFDEPEIQTVAEKHNATEAQVTLAWLREKGVTAIPKATGGTHLRENLESTALKLDNEDVRRIDSIDRTERQVDPDMGPW